MSELTLEYDLQARGRNAPRLKPSDIDQAIVGEDFHRFPGTTTIACCLKLRNGFSTVGTSGCVSEANFDEEIGRRVARENARSEIWKLEGYLLRERLFSGELEEVQDLQDMPQTPEADKKV